jgi:hypothetical protein
MKILILSYVLIMSFLVIGIREVRGGCIGPVIMGDCKGTTVPWDTHPSGYQERQPAPPGFFWDRRGSETERRHPEWINPFTGRDGHDSNWFKQQEK